jgi:hypothetical protein
MLANESGTSMAAPQITHLAASILAEYPSLNTDAVRALLVANAAIPEPAGILFEDKKNLRKICGYGQVDARALLRSMENEVNMLAVENIRNKTHHFFEIPIPDDFLTVGKRHRQISIGLSHTPYVRTTRVSYKAGRINFKLVTAESLEYVTKMFNKATAKEEYDNIPELSKPDISNTMRGKGTAQAATWNFNQFNSRSKLKKNRLFVVVTRYDQPWGEAHTLTEESYALVVCIRDRSNADARLYSQIQTKLSARTRARARV